MLADKEISKKMNQATNALIIEGVDPDDNASKLSQIQPSSVDLRVGSIYRPVLGRIARWFSAEAPGQPLSEVSLSQGETVIIKTKEKITLPNSLSGIVFPPARVSTKGLLMTNVGHVDAGFCGFLHLTVINMGRSNYIIRSGDRLASLLLFSVSPAAKTGWLDRQNVNEVSSNGLLDTARESLSTDFLDIHNRAQRAAKAAVTRNSVLQYIIPILLAVGAAYVGAALSSKEDAAKIAKLEAQMDGFGDELGIGELKAELDLLKKEVRDVE